MSSFLPRRYNNPLFIGLGVGLVIAIGVIIYLWSQPATPEKAKIEAAPDQRQEPSGTVLSSGKPALVMIYADWCGHSKAMLPTWQLVKEKLQSTGQFEVFDFNDKDDLAELKRLPANEIEFPSIRFYTEGYPNGTPIKYRGDRSEESILKFAYTAGKQT